ncbi:multidrug effflux MFS transporter [Steroidobacter sp. S1-65]|uniref:Bcr/CflA family efflux transporter n=1 Tax=Steroidobacter gossypii TaxID=2805490 RepID=A0ABS1X298_9GAMM|nr:multidrug effflux MFS transporter [Steroidobacter gossypii]MBM0107357.1 multidrug effflux MFS transporter [Steroidobacter gossypii]
MLRHPTFLIVVLGFLNALTPFTIDLYLPAFPQIAADLDVAVSRMSLSVSVYFIGFALGQVIYGPLLDRFGRQRPIYAGLAIYILATLGCMTTTSFEGLLVFRFISALGGSAASVGAVALVRDHVPADRAARAFAMLMLVLSVSPLLAPSIGSVIATAASWRAIFAALAALAIIDLALVVFAIPRTYSPDPSVSLRLAPIMRTFRDALAQPQFRIYTLAGSLSFAGLFVFVSGSPAVFMDGFGVGPGGFGAIFAILAGGMILGGQLNHLLLRYFPSELVFRRALLIQVLSGAAFLLLSLTFQLGKWETVALLFAFLHCAGITYPNAAALALKPFTKNIGSASSLLGFLQLGFGAVAAALVGVLDLTGPLPMAFVMAICSATGWVILMTSAHATNEANAGERASG